MNLEIKMNPAAKKVWVKALRSGKFKQGKGKLKRYDETYCCLGVYCEAVYGFHIPNYEMNMPTSYEHLDHEDMEFFRQEPRHCSQLQGLIAQWNDGLGLTFDQIADKIEELF